MSRGDDAKFRVPVDLPVDGLDPGTNVMVAGPSSRGARTVALRLVMAGVAHGEGALLLSADVGGRALLDRATDVVGEFDRSRVGVVDCSGVDDDQQRFDERGDPIDDPGDLLRIEMETSVLYETLLDRDLDRVRIGAFSVSSLLAHADLESVSRFVHMLTGRVVATGDLGVFVVDSSMQDDRTVDAIEGYCDVSIDVREEDGEFEVRVRGPDSAPWTPFATDERDGRPGRP